MIELFLSTDGKHTVHVSADTPEQLKSLLPNAKALYREVLAEFGAKAEPRQSAVNGNGQAKSNGHAPAGKRFITSAEAEVDAIPHCPMHKRPMAFRQGRLGPFWSCPTRKPDGRWCQVTKEVTGTGNGQLRAA
jgi:hypothetical protein